MKTNANVLTAKRQALHNNAPAVLKKVSVNQTLSPFRRQRTESPLTIQGYELREWLEHLSNAEGIYFLDFKSIGNYSLHFKHHATGQLMEMEQPKKDDMGILYNLDALLFDLSLFPDAPILVFDAAMFEVELQVIQSMYHRPVKEIDDTIGRLVNTDMKNLFGKGIFCEPMVKQLSVDRIYQALFPGTSRSFKEQGSYGMYLIYLAVESIFNQVIGKKA